MRTGCRKRANEQEKQAAWKHQPKSEGPIREGMAFTVGASIPGNTLNKDSEGALCFIWRCPVLFSVSNR